MIFDESYECFEEITDELFDVPENTMKCFCINFTEKDLEDIPSICEELKFLLNNEYMDIEESEMKILAEKLAESPGLDYCVLFCFYLVSNQKIAQIGISRDTDGSFLIPIEMEDMNNSKTWRAKGFRKLLF